MELAVHYRCLTKCHEAVRALDLPGLPVDRVLLRKFPTDRLTDDRQNIPCIVVSLPPGGAIEAYEPNNMNERDDVGYPVMVTFIQASNQKLEADLDFGHFLTWREKVVRRFRYQRLDGVPEIFFCRPEPQPILDPDLFFDKQLDVGAVLLRFISREARGL